MENLRFALEALYLLGHAGVLEVKKKIQRGIDAAWRLALQFASEELGNLVQKLEQYIPNITPVRNLVNETLQKLSNARYATDVVNTMIEFEDNLNKLVRQLSANLDKETVRQLHEEVLDFFKLKELRERIYSLFGYFFDHLRVRSRVKDIGVENILKYLVEEGFQHIAPSAEQLADLRPTYSRVANYINAMRDAFLEEIREIQEIIEGAKKERTADKIRQMAEQFVWEDPSTGKKLTAEDISQQAKAPLFEKFGRSLRKSIVIRLTVQVDLKGWAINQVAEALISEMSLVKNRDELLAALATQLFDTKWDVVGRLVWEKAKARAAGEVPELQSERSARRYLKEVFFNEGQIIYPHLFTTIRATAREFIREEIWHEGLRKVGKSEVLQLLVTALKRWFGVVFSEDIAEKAATVFDDQTIKNKYLNAYVSRVIQQVGEWRPEIKNRVVTLELVFSLHLGDFLALGHFPFDGGSCYGKAFWYTKVHHFVYEPRTAVCFLIHPPHSGNVIGRAIVNFKDEQVEIEDEHFFIDPDAARQLFGGYNSDLKKAIVTKLARTISEHLRRWEND